MARPRRLVALMLDLDWGYKRHHELLVGIQQYARERGGWKCVFDPFAGETISRRRAKPAYQGIIARSTHKLAAQAAKAGVPVVNIWLSSPDRKTPRVVSDFEAAGRMAAEHLIARGLKQFGFLGYRGIRSSAAEFAGFRAVVERTGAACGAQFISVGCTRNSRNWSRMVAGLSEWIKRWKLPIGIFGTQDLACRYLVDVCLRHGLRIPEDVAIVGLGNEPVICDEGEPTLSSIELGAAKMGFQAAKLLDGLMRGKPPPPKPIMVEPAELVVRNSTDVLAVDDNLVGRAMQFMAEHGHEPIRVPDVVAALPVTRRSLERRFRATLGRSIAEEICRLRLARAKRLIVGTTASISSIASSAGFSNKSYFTRAFRRSEGMTPMAFRRWHAS